MRILKIEDKADRKITADETSLLVSVTHAVKPEGRDSREKIELTWIFDFANVSKAELLECAVRRLVVDRQNELRGNRAAIVASEKNKISVRDMLDAERASAKRDPIKTVANLFGSMSPEEQAALINRLQEQVKKDASK